MPEFNLIRRITEIIDVPLSPGNGRCVLGIGDDAALLEVPHDRQLAVCSDTLVEGIHFPVGSDPHAVGHKSLAVNLSDLAAMCADPAWFLLALTLPDGDPQWLESFATGMAELARDHGLALVGGDTTSGGLSITVTAAGLVDPDRALLRSGARPGDRILVSGRPGRAAFALQQVLAGADADASCRQALDYPVPRLALGRALRGLASACIDISDGLAADLGHILEHSAVGAEVELGALPLALASLPEEERWTLQLAGGDDYELCFTVPAERLAQVMQLADETGVEVSEIGKIRSAPGLVFKRPGGGAFELGDAGFEHFSTPVRGRD